MANIEDQVNEARQYVSKLDEACVYTDGYQCADDSSKDYDDALDGRGLLPGIYLQAWMVAHQRFVSEQRLSEEQRNLKHYKIGFLSDRKTLTVLFRPLFLPRIEEGKIVGRLRATFGKEVKIAVDLNSNEVVSVLYGK